MDVSTLKALTFDVFGTVVDWPSTVIQETEQLGQAKGIKADWAKCAGLPWDCVLSAELAKYYKPAPEVYQVAADLLGT